MENLKSRSFLVRMITELFDVGPLIALSVLAITAVALVSATVYFIRSAPPSKVTISAGPEGSSYYKYAQKYAEILARNGVKLEILPSEGSYQNLHRIKKREADLGFVQAGTIAATGGTTENLISLGSISYQPLLLFYRGKPIEILSQLKGKKVAVGPHGTGERRFAIEILKANGIEEKNDPTTLLEWESSQSAKALLDGQIDAAFVMSENASVDIMRELVRAKGVHLYSFKQANAYSRKVENLNVLDLPEGGIDLGSDIPPHDVSLLGPMVELIAAKGLHPAISDLVLEAAEQVHSRAGLFQRRGEFPAPIEHVIPLSEDTVRYFKSGKTFFYKYLPFWLASLLSRIVVVIFPLLVVLIPMLKSVPAFFRWRIQKKIHRRYRELLDVEREFVTSKDLEKQDQLRHRFDHVESQVYRMKVPASFADQFYGLRGHIDYVRQLIAKKQT